MELDLRDENLLFDLQVCNARNVLHCRRNDLGLLLQTFDAGSKDADDDRTASAAENLLDPFLQIGQQIARESRISVDDLWIFATVLS